MARRDAPAPRDIPATPPILRTAKADEEANGWSDGLAALGGLLVLAGANAALSYLIFLL